MACSDEDIQRYIARLTTKGYRMTLPRKLIIERLYDAQAYPTVDDVYDMIHSHYPHIGIATIYRTMALFEEIGIVHKVNVGDRKARYELCLCADRAQHYHQLICSRCAEIIRYSDFSEQEVTQMCDQEKRLETQYGFVIDRHVVQYYGVCPECQKKGAEIDS